MLSPINYYIHKLVLLHSNRPVGSAAQAALYSKLHAVAVRYKILDVFLCVLF